MKKFTMFVLVVFACTTMFAANPFSDVSKDHWAFKAIESLAGKGVLEGYPDGSFKGAKTLTRYEAAMMVAKLMGNMGGMGLGAKDLATLEKLIVEFSDELALIGVKVTALEDQVGTLKNDVASMKASCASSTGTKSGKIDITGDMKMTIGTREYETDSSAAFLANGSDNLGIVIARENDWENEYKIGLNLFANIDEDVTGFVRLRGVGILGSGHENDALWNATQVVSFDDSRGLNPLQDLTLGVEYAYIDVKNIFDLGDLRLGRQNITLGHNLVYAAPADAMKFDKVMDQVSVSMFAFDSNNSMFDLYVNTTNGVANHNGVVGAQLHENGFDSKAVNIGVDFGGHAVGMYYFTQSFDVYDPYARMGDRYAVSYGVNKTGGAVNGVAANDHYSSARQANAVQGFAVPSADPTWWALTLDGNVMENLDYFFEYISYDSDLASANNVTAIDFTAVPVNGSTDNTADAINVVLPGRELGGNAWLLGFDWDLTDDLNLVAQYGAGDEEFVPSTIDIRQRLNGMMGRFNAQAARADYYWAPTGSLQGVKDLFAKLSYDFNDKTSGYLSYENCKENDTSAYINVVATDNLVYNTALAAAQRIYYTKPSEYTALGFGVKHQYRPNTAFTLDYTNLSYDQDDFDHNADANADTAPRKFNLAPNAGGWQMIKAAVEVKF